jgi:hypothetical protein
MDKLIIFLVFQSCIPSFLFLLVAFYSKKLLNNIKKNEQFVTSLLFVHPKTPSCFLIVSLVMILFATSFLTYSISFIIGFVSVTVSYFVLFITYLVLLSFIYFFKTLYDITKSEEHGA